MPLHQLNPAEILQKSNKHVALIGKFSINGDPIKSWSGGEIKQSSINYELGYRKTTRVIGQRNFDSFEVLCPKDCPQGTPTLSLGNSPLGEALKAKDGDLREVGGKIFVQLLNSLDKLSSYWHPDFDRLLAGAFFFFCEKKNFKPDPAKNEVRTPTSSELQAVIYDARINQALLAFFRFAPGDVQSARENLSTVLQNHPLGSFILREAEGFRAALGKETPGAGEISKTLYNGGSDQKKFLGSLSAEMAGMDAGGKPNEKLVTLYRDFREHASIVEQISRCEPLTAMMIWWLFGKLQDTENTQEIAEAIIEKVYKPKGELWKPRLGPEKLKEDQSYYQAVWNSAYNSFLKQLNVEKGKKEDDPKAIIYKMVMTDVLAHREATWKPSPSFSRADLIQRNVRTFMALAAETIAGVQKVIEASKNFLDQANPAYRNFEAAYGDQLTQDKLKEILAGVPAELKSWGTSFLLAHEKETGATLGNSFRKEFHAEVAKIQSKSVETYLAKEGQKAAAQLKKVGEAYRAQLQSQESSTKKVFPAGGSLLGVSQKAPANPDSAKQEKVAVRRGIKEMYEAAVTQPGVKIPLNEAIAEKLKDKQLPQAKIVRESGVEGSGQLKVELSSEFKASALKEGEGHDFSDLAELVDQYANELAEADSNLENIRAGILKAAPLSSEAKTVTRGKIRSTLLGEFLLATPGELSPLQKNDSSLGTAGLLEMVEKVGAKKAYMGENRKALIEKKVDLDCGVADLDLHNIWEVSNDQSGLEQIEQIVTYWREIAEKVFSVKNFVADMALAEELVKLISKDPEARLTVVNETLAEHLAQDRLDLFIWSNEREIPPPSAVVITGQGTNEQTIGSELQALQGIILGNDNSIVQWVAQNGNGVDELPSIPILIIPFPLPPNATTLPFIYQPELQGPWLVSVLTGLKQFPQPLGTRFSEFKHLTGLQVAQRHSFDDMTGTVIKKHWLGPVMTSKILNYGLAQRWTTGAEPNYGKAVWEALQNVRSLCSQLNASTVYFQREGKWVEVKESRHLPGGRFTVGIQTDAQKDVTQLDELEKIFSII